MKSQWKVARLAGIDVRLHVTFPFLLLWVGYYQYSLHESWEDVWSGLAFVGLLFVAIVLHELGHAFAARRFGIRTRDITLLPIGGVARLERMPVKPFEELIVSVSGPAVNVVLAAGLFMIIGGQQAVALRDSVTVRPADFLGEFAHANLWLAAFNLLPAFPLDGGRVLRALLALKLDRSRATRLAARIGQSSAVLLGLLGLVYNPLLVMVAIFIWIAGSAESEADLFKAVIAGIRVEEVMLRDCPTFAPTESLARATNHLLAATLQDFPVLDSEGHLLGLLRRADLLQGLATSGPLGFVGDVMLRQVPTARIGETIEQLLRHWPSDQPTVAVLCEKRFAGLLTQANLGEFLMVKSSLQRHAERAPALGTSAPIMSAH